MEEAARLLSERFGHREFLAGQEESLRSVLSGGNLLVVMPTGSGKSLLYQLPALMGKGLTLVVSPLIALMKDQVDELARKGVSATFINSSLGLDEQRGRMAACADGKYKLLYVAPERFRNATFAGMVSRVKVERMAVDEAHCISEWGHDFRPDYLRLREFRRRLGNPKVTALTATATPRVRKDVIESLGLTAGEVDVHVHGFSRPNLEIEVEPAYTETEKIIFLEEFLRENPGSGIIYAGTRRAAEEAADSLSAAGQRVGVYHAGMEPDQRERAQDRFISGKDRVVAATSAFGMGIDKPDVRFVVHYSYPGSVEQYYQEIGRAGRDGLISKCVLLYSPSDRRLREFFIDMSYPKPEQVEDVYRALWKIKANPIMMTYRGIAALCDGNVKDMQVGAAVRLLDNAGLTRAFSGEQRVAVTFDRPGSRTISSVKGPVQRRVLEAISSVADLEEPGRHEISLTRLCLSAGLDEEQVKRALASLDNAGVIEYEPPFRGRGIEKLIDTPPPFKKAPIDWDKHEKLRKAEYEKLEAMEKLIAHPSCRHEYILNYFGEKSAGTCGSCDRCREEDEPESASGILAESPHVAAPILLCVSRLRFPLGRGKIAQVVTGSRDKNLIKWKLDRNPAYGKVSANQDEVKKTISALFREGYLENRGEAGRPVVGLTSKGHKAALKIKPASLSAPPEETKPAKRRKAGVSGNDATRLAALKCVAQVSSPVGVGRVAAILAGSRASWVGPLKADRLEVYGSIHDSQENLRDKVQVMLIEGLFKKSGSPKYPVLALTEKGRGELKRLCDAGADFEETAAEDKSQEARAVSAPSDSAADDRESYPERAVEDVDFSGDEIDLWGEYSSSFPERESQDEYQEALETARAPEREAAGALERLIDELSAADHERASEVLGRFSIFSPKAIGDALVKWFLKTDDARGRRTVIWATGEICGLESLGFLLARAGDEDEELRVAARGAIEKIASKARSDINDRERELSRAMEAILSFQSDKDG